MYLLFSNSQLIGYSYNAMAVKVLEELCKKQKEAFPLNVVETSDTTLLKEHVVKDPGHIENLVRWYSKNGYSFYYWKYIQYNRNAIKEFSIDFIREFHNLYEDLYIRALDRMLNELLIKEII